MGLLDRFRANRSFGRVSEKADTGVDLDEDKQFIMDTKHAIRTAKKTEEREDDFIESREERRERRRKKLEPIRKGVKRAKAGYARYQKSPARRAVRGFLNDTSTDMFGGSRRKKKGDFNPFDQFQ